MNGLAEGRELAVTAHLLRASFAIQIFGLSSGVSSHFKLSIPFEMCLRALRKSQECREPSSDNKL